MHSATMDAANGKMRSCVDFDDQELACFTLAMLRRMTGDLYRLRLVSQSYWTIVRYDPTGREVLWE